MPRHEGPPGHHRGPPHHLPRPPREDRIVEALRVLVRTGKVQEVQQLAALAGELDPSGDAAAFLMENCARLPAALALDKLAVHQRERAYDRRVELLESAKQKAVILIAPIPPDLYDEFAWLEGAWVLKLDEHDLPPHLRYAPDLKVCDDPYDAGQLAEQADVVIFDCHYNSVLHVRRSIAGLLDIRHLKPEASLFAHFRAHPTPTDVPLAASVSERIQRI